MNLNIFFLGKYYSFLGIYFYFLGKINSFLEISRILFSSLEISFYNTSF